MSPDRRAHCICPDDDRYRCIRVRYGREEHDDEGCSCACHDEIEADMDEEETDAR
jgi:hypothetical protein